MADRPSPTPSEVLGLSDMHTTCVLALDVIDDKGCPACGARFVALRRVLVSVKAWLEMRLDAVDNARRNT